MASPGNPVSVDRLTDEAWDGVPPPSARNTVQSYISRLRSSCGLRIDRLGDAYVLECGPDELDVIAFERSREVGSQALREGRWAAAQVHLSEALAQWRGRAFEGLEDLDTPRSCAIRLEEQRLDALEWLMEVELEVGAFERCIAHGELVSTEAPWRERARCFRATALARTGRTGQALAELSEYRQLLLEGGQSAGPAVDDLEQAILTRRLAMTSSLPVDQLPGGLPPELARLTTANFVGRHDELAMGRRLEGEAIAGTTTAMFISGEAGVGKTAVASELASAFEHAELRRPLRPSHRATRLGLPGARPRTAPHPPGADRCDRGRT